MTSQTRTVPSPRAEGSSIPAGGASFDAALAAHGCRPLARGPVQTLQVNLGKRCNQACHHCHVDAGPTRTEAMSGRDVTRVLDLLERSPGVETLDITGGAPELHPEFRRLAAGARALGRRVIDRCNLTVLFEPGQEDTAGFLARHGISIVASLPCYTRDNVEAQRGKGVFEPSIEALRGLNRLGYGLPDSPLELDLVYNPLGPSLPPPQPELEADYRRELGLLFGIRFHRLYALANIPIRRFAAQLARRGELEAYEALLAREFNRHAVDGLMCRSLVSVGYDGRLYDCDFNQMQELPAEGRARTLWDIERLEDLAERPVATGRHCFGCTAGSGSSCTGAIAEPAS
jgi:radical SAM/Cys-rich protein